MNKKTLIKAAVIQIRVVVTLITKGATTKQIRVKQIRALFITSTSRMAISQVTIIIRTKATIVSVTTIRLTYTSARRR